jgi:hypothetical protein
MKILVGIWHPAHVHFFKNFIWEMERRGHEIKIIILEKEMNKKILDIYNFKYESIGKNEIGLFKKLKNTIIFDIKVYRIAKEFKPDIMVGIAAIFFAHIGKLLNIPSIIFTDSETSGLINTLTFPFADVICTPDCFLQDLGKKHIKYAGYHELAYLHPNNFKPRPEVLEKLNLSINDRFFVIRFISWGASHDIRHYGIRDKIGLVKSLEKYGRVLLTSEGELPPELKPYLMEISPDKLHDLLSFATLYVGEGATIASEAAVLGTPSIFVSSLAANLGNFIELEKTYDLLYSFTDGNAALEKSVVILQDTKSKENWLMKRERLLKDKIDVTAFMVWFIENYPSSRNKIWRNDV